MYSWVANWRLSQPPSLGGQGAIPFASGKVVVESELAQPYEKPPLACRLHKSVGAYHSVMAGQGRTDNYR
jgi:hypothetical protein